MAKTAVAQQVEVPEKLLKEATERLKRVEGRKRLILAEYIKLGTDLGKISYDYLTEPVMAAKLYQEESWEYLCKRVGYHHKSVERIIDNSTFFLKCEKEDITLEEISQVGNYEKLSIIRRYFHKHPFDKNTAKQLINMAIALPDQGDFSKEVKSLSAGETEIKDPEVKVHYDKAFNKVFEFFDKQPEDATFGSKNICKIMTDAERNSMY